VTGLTAAHRGYEYQDLMTACRLVDVVLGTAHGILVDEKLFTGDRFDDLTAWDDERRERTQFKHTDSDDKPLTLATFTGDKRDLRLDLLVRAAAADRAGLGASAAPAAYRILLRDTRPVDEGLLAVLRPAAPDPGPYQPGMTTLRLRFDADVLWDPSGSGDGTEAPFAFLRDGDRRVSREDLGWFCESAVVEVGAPRASWDLTAPGPAEALLLERLRTEIGAGTYPNRDRSAVDVAEAFIRLARTARQGSADVTREEILRRAQLRQDYGAVARARPAAPSVAIARDAAVGKVADAAASAACGGGAVVVTAPPGHGKSWLCDQLVSHLADAGWLVAEHYCYLGDADDERIARVIADSLFGSLLARVADADPGAVEQQRPLLAASEDALVDAVAATVARKPGRPVALIVDGLDHVTRVRNDSVGFDASHAIAEALAAFELPPGSALIVLSQPGGHLQPLLDGAPATVEVPGLTRPELTDLAATLGMPAGWDNGDLGDIVDALVERSGGNALYATYLCREILRDPARAESAAAVLRLPPFDGTLANYYQHLWSTLEQQAWWVAEVIGVIDFAVTRDELREINPGAGHRVNAALDALAPVLIERPGDQGRVRIYHESFGRYLRQQLQGDSAALAAVLGRIADWLRARGMFEDTRAFRSLISVLARAGRHREAAELVDHDFVVNAVAAAFPTSAIRACLATAASSAAQSRDWAAAVRCVELSRAAETLQEERFESAVVGFADVVVSLVGANAVSDRLLHEGRTVMAGRVGLQMCAAVDQLGGVPPWREYMAAYSAEADNDNTSYGEDSDTAVDLAWLRGRLRLSAASRGPLPAARRADAPDLTSPDDDFSAPIRWEAVSGYYDEGRVPASALVRLIADTYGDQAADAFASMPDRAGPYCLAMAEAVAAGHLTGSSCTARAWVWATVAHGLPDGSFSRLIAVGLDPDAAAESPYDQGALLQLTREVQQYSVRWEHAVLPRWMDKIAAAARVDPLGLNTAEALIDGPGWYRCWLRFCIALARAETVPTANRDAAVEDAIALLTADVRPFEGSPRACDLYPIYGTVQATVRRALSAIADDDAWERAVGVLRKVGADISTTISGELGGPLPSDLLMRLTIRTAPPTKLATVRALAATQAEQSGARFYSDIAETKLLSARTELAADARDEAKALWRQACQLLVAYGWHKDITVYELLDPFPALIDTDPRRARQRLPAIQAICERVWLHTDGKETRGAPGRWWELLAAADPVALAALIAPAVLARCNEPDDHLHDALAALWRAWSETADPFVASALRLAISPALDPADPAAVARLAGTAPTPASGPGRLLASCLARFDERSPSYSFTNSDDMLASDENVVAAINAAAKPVPGAPAALPLPKFAAPTERHEPHKRPASATQDGLAARLGSLILPAFPSGPVGLARAVWAWQSRPYSDESDEWGLDRAANVLGYRLLEMAQDGRREEASAYLEQIADGGGFGRDSDLLAALADGFAQRGETGLAAGAGALAWTRARGRGGWLAFGGETHLDALRTATTADLDAAMAVVGDEITRAIRSDRSGTRGIAQALVVAFVAGAAATDQADGVEAAFACFDAALDVIDARTPRIHAHDVPDLPYSPPSPDCGEKAPGDIDNALAAAAIAGLARPEREAKRRALLATEYLLAERPATVADGIKHALAHLSDPATLTWLLSLLARSASPGSPALALSDDALATLAAGPHLAVRVLARSLTVPQPSLSPPEPADPELIGTAATVLWTPDPEEPNNPDDGVARETVNEAAGQRLTAAEPLLPGLTAATVRRTASALDGETLTHRMRRQLHTLQDKHGTERRWPDAWLATSEAAEDALQRAATGARSAALRRGALRDPAACEVELADRLVDPPRLALALEATRIPRPAVPPPPSRYDPLWATISTAAAAAPGDGDLDRACDAACGTVAAAVVTAFGQLDDASGGWRVLASVEALCSSAPRGDEQRDVRVFRYRGLEVREEYEQGGLDLPPFGGGDLDQWERPLSVRARFGSAQSLAGLDVSVGAATDSRWGLGLPERVVVPGLALLAALRPTETGWPFELRDKDGLLAALRTWRALYETSDYHQPWPRLTGAALILTQRGFDRIRAEAPRLVLRDFISRKQDSTRGWNEDRAH
jgi:hypothetical protein